MGGYNINACDWSGILRNLLYKKLVSKILTHSKNLNFSIWACEPGMEKKWGCDIDIYIERNVNDFILFAFQAKILKLGQFYADLDKFSKGSYQYQKLENYGVFKKCHTNYLLYNGVSGFYHNGNNKCSSPFSEDQFGLSYVSIDDIKSVIKTKANWTFQYFHPTIASPLSELVCCRNNNSLNIKSYDYKEISQTLDEYQQLIFEDDINQYFEKAIGEDSDKNEDDISKDVSERKPEIVIVLRNTTSTY